MKRIGILALLTVALSAPAAEQIVDVPAFVRKDRFDDIKLSPKGDYYAATMRHDDRTTLVIIRRADNKVTANVGGGGHIHVKDFHWVSPERVVVSLAEKSGPRDEPWLTGELYATNADGSRRDILVGLGVVTGLGSRIQPKKEERVFAFLVDDLPADDRNVIVSVGPFSREPHTRAERMDVYSGRRVQVAAAPVARADFVTDNQGVVRFAQGAGGDNASKLYYRGGDGDEWSLLHDEAVTGRAESAIGFSADDRIAYLWVEHDEGPDSIVAYDVATGTRSEILRDDNVDPARIIYRVGTHIPVGAFFDDGKPRTAFFDSASPEARLYRSLEKAFPGEMVRITSQTTDGRLALVQVSSDRNPGDFYVLDTAAKKVDHLLSRRSWLEPARMAPMQPFQLTARDGLALHGYLTVPAGSTGKGLPMVVMPHGGPFHVQDAWMFDNDTQLLASAGYAVLRLNFRGSSGYGHAFTEAGARQWGGTMQDDLTDATRWAIQQGIADPKRVCIYGASYGGYAALMGVAKEPSLYRCAVGYIGVYDLPIMHTRGDLQRSNWGETWLKDWVGDPTSIGAVSPARLADRIKVPVFLVAGGQDQRAPIEHSKRMESALRKAGVPVETLYYDTEGHGFYSEDHEREFYTRLLAFLSRHLGGGVAATGGGGMEAAK